MYQFVSDLVLFWVKGTDRSGGSCNGRGGDIKLEAEGLGTARWIQSQAWKKLCFLAWLLQ
jgi:hypothetical protein